ncbi:hypothetical protein [Amycolatopsis sp. NPDC059021]|uniref:hypothetical protein n=1 Tax=Amycolatopsis sp. NPDC059021 TaxID=3346704 RepID=UPI00366C4FD5
MTEATVFQALESRRPGEPAGPWLSRILAALPSERPPSEKCVDTLAHVLVGGAGDVHPHLDEDPAAQVGFWRTLSTRFPGVPRLRGIYADTLLLTGSTDEALREFLAAFTADPLLIYRFSGDLSDLFERAGGVSWALYRALVIVAAERDDPDGNRDYIAEQQRLLVHDLREQPALLQPVLGILRPLRR